MPPTFRLDLLGDPAFSGPGGPVRGRAAHKRRVALLAVLAVARGRPVGRERLIGLLWPDLTTDAARHNLSESLYVLRKELGEGSVSAASAGDVALNPGVVATDVAEFQDRLDAGDAEGAAALYRGPLLDGFYVSEAPEFERWVDGERDRLARAFAAALEGLAQAAEAEGSAIRAVDWWRRLAAHDPFSSRTALRLVRALDAAGERPSALRAAEGHAALLRQELGVEPDPDLLALVARLRADPPRAAAPLPALARDPVPEPPSAEPPRTTPPAPVWTATAPPISDPAAEDASPSAPLGPARVKSGPVMENAARENADGAIHHPPILSAVVPAAGLGPGPAAAAELSPAAPPGPPGGETGPVTENAARTDADGATHHPSLRSAVVPAAGPGRRLGTSTEPSPAAPPSGSARRAASLRRRDSLPIAAAGGVLLGLLLSFLASWDVQRPPEPVPRYDPRRIAVLYFEDLSPGGELRYLAAGLTERLIHELGQVPVLDVVSRGGVRAYRGRSVRPDSIAAQLRAGSVVEGTLQRSGDSVWVTVALVDANTQRQLQSRVVGRPMGDVVALERAVAAEVSAALRRRLGQEVRLHAAARETESAEARDAVLMAEQLRRDSREMAGGGDALDGTSAARLLQRADSLLERAHAADPGWDAPALLRGWVDVDRATLARGAARQARLRSAATRGAAVLAGESGRAGALELRGTALYRLALDERDTLAQRVRLDSAEQDLRAGVAAEPARASAWSTLSQLLRIRGRLAESDVAARRALAEDAYLEDAADIRHRLFFSALWRADYAGAREECETGRAQFADDWRFTECRLTLLRNDGSRRADPVAAWRLVAELDSLDPPARARAQGRFYGPVYRRMVAAAVSARAGDTDSARAVAARARREAGADPGLGFSLDYDEAWVRLALGDTAGARALTARMGAARPDLRAYLERDPLIRELGAP